MSEATPQRREFVRFAFYKVDPAWRRLDKASRSEAAAEVESVVSRYAEGMMIRPYSTVGMRADSDLCFWTASHELGSIQDFARDFDSTGLGKLSANTHSFLSITTPSTYLHHHTHPPHHPLHTKPS